MFGLAFYKVVLPTCLQLMQNEVIPACVTPYPHENNEHIPNNNTIVHVNVRNYLNNVFFCHQMDWEKGNID